jgi:hypothetical protein
MSGVRLSGVSRHIATHHNRGGKGIRTPDPLHAMQVLYQLSYTPKGTSMLAVGSCPP